MLAADRVRSIFEWIFYKKVALVKKLEVLARLQGDFPPDDDLQPAVAALIEGIQVSNQLLTYEHVVKHHQFPITLQNNTPTITQAEALSLVVKETEFRRKQAVSRSLLDVCKDIHKLSQADIYDKTTKAVSGLQAQTTYVAPPSGKQVYDQRAATPAGLVTMIKPLDDVIGGIEFGTVCTIAGFAGSFKTTFGVNLLYQNITKAGYDGMMFTMEVPRDLIYFMLLSRHSYNPKFVGKGQPVDHEKIRKSLLTDEEYDFVFNVVEPDLINDPSHGKFFILEETDFDEISVPGIVRKIHSLPADIDFVIVDYIQLFQYLDHKGSAKQQNSPLDYYVRCFARLALNFAKKDGSKKLLAIIILSQTNREGWKRAVDNNGQYDMLALSEARELERSSYYVVFLFSDEQLKESNELKLQLAKQRGGRTILEPFIAYCDPRFVVIGDDVAGVSNDQEYDFSGLVSLGGDGGLFSIG